METQPAPQISPEHAASIFISWVVDRAYVGALQSTASMLSNGPTGRHPPPETATLHRWFSTLQSSDKQLVLASLKVAIESAIFGLLVILDGKTGGWPVADHASDFATYVQTYPSDAAWASNSPSQAVRFDGSLRPIDLHDLFIDAVRPPQPDPGSSVAGLGA